MTTIFFVVFQLRISEFGRGITKNLPRFGTTETRLLPPQNYFDLFWLAFSVVTLVGNPGFCVSTHAGQMVVYVSALVSIFLFILTILCFLDRFDLSPSEELPHKVYQLVCMTENQQDLAAAILGLHFRLWKAKATGSTSSVESIQRRITQTSMRLRKLRITHQNMISKQRAGVSLINVSEEMEKSVRNLTRRLHYELRRAK